MNNYKEFITRFKLLTEKNKLVVSNTLSNIFTMRLIGNKTHGDLAEVGMVEFINQFMYDYTSTHVGKDRFRAKEHEEDILVKSNLTKEEIPISMKAYGDGPLQLSTDKNMTMFPFLKNYGIKITDKKTIQEILKNDIFKDMMSINTMPMIYREIEKTCNILIFDFFKMLDDTASIVYLDQNTEHSSSKKQGKGRVHPIYLFSNLNGEYIAEVRYGGASANALQRGFWTNTKRAVNYFTSATGGWIKYDHNHSLVKLIMLALNSTESAHQRVNVMLEEDIQKLKK
jgi:hypothetical protein